MSELTPEGARRTLVRACVDGASRLGVGRWATILLAVSGGPDSMALLHGMAGGAEERGWRPVVVHLDHRLRPTSSDDARMVADAAARLGLGCELGAADVRDLARREHRSLEDAGRRARYRLLREVADRTAPDAWIATGHTADDQAETVLLRLIRGSGLHGLRGIPPRRGRIVRPLLGERRATLRSLLDAAGIGYLHDETNDDPSSASRNRVRAELLPVMERLNGRVVDALGRYAWLAADDEDLLGRLAAAELHRRTGPDGRLDWHDPPPRALGRRVIRLAVGEPVPDAARVEALLEAAEGPRGGLTIELGGGRSVEVRSRQLRLA